MINFQQPISFVILFKNFLILNGFEGWWLVNNEYGFIGWVPGAYLKKEGASSDDEDDYIDVAGT